MATTWLKGLKKTNLCASKQTISRSINYYTNPKKTQDGKLVTAINCSAEGAVLEFQLQQKIYETEKGKPVEWSSNGLDQGNVAYHMRQSFKPGEVDADTAHAIGVKLINKFLGNELHNYQCIATTHVDQKHIHNDIIFNAVGLDGKKFNSKKYDYKIIRELNDSLCKKAGLSVVISSKNRCSRLYSKGPCISYRKELKDEFDNALSVAKSYDELISILSKNYEIDDTHKYMTFRHKANGQQRNIRSDNLGEKYAREALMRRFSTMEKIKRKMKMPFRLHLKARAKINLDRNANMTYSQKLSHIRSLMVTFHALNEFNVNCYQDITSQINSLDGQLADTELQIQTATQKLDSLKSICKSCSVYSDTKHIFNEYQKSLLKNSFQDKNKNQLELHYLAEKHLQQMGIDPNDFNINSIQANIEMSNSQLNSLNQSFAETKFNFERLTKTRTSVDSIKMIRPVFSETKTKGVRKHAR